MTFAFDALGRKVASGRSGVSGNIAYQYDAAGNRTLLTWPDGSMWATCAIRWGD